MKFSVWVEIDLLLLVSKSKSICSADLFSSLVFINGVLEEMFVLGVPESGLAAEEMIWLNFLKAKENAEFDSFEFFSFDASLESSWEKLSELSYVSISGNMNDVDEDDEDDEDKHRDTSELSHASIEFSL